MEDPLVLLVALLALLAGLAIGKAWERYKLQDGRWIDRRRARESPHYMLGLNFLVANQIDPGDRRARARRRSSAGDPLEIHLILGNLYREKGQVGRAIQEHQALLQRPTCASSNTPTCCSASASTTSAADSSTARSRPSPRSSGSIPTTSTRCRTSRSCTRSSTSGRRPTRRARSSPRADDRRHPVRHHEILAFLENELGLEALKRMDYAEAARRFEAAIELDSPNAPAYLNLGDVRFLQGRRDGRDRRLGAADRARRPSARTWRSRGSRRVPEGRRRAQRFAALCRRLIAANPQDWRARLALARHLSAQRRSRRGARAAVRSARAQPARAGAAPGDLADALAASPAAGAGRPLRRPDARRDLLPRSRTSACAAATAAPSCSGSARTATSGTRSSKNASRRRRTRKRRSRS